MLRVKDEEYYMSRDQDYYSSQDDRQLSDEFSENELELYKQYRAGTYDEHNVVIISAPCLDHFKVT